MNALVILLLILVGLAAVSFMGGIVAAGILSVRGTPEKMPTFAIQVITGIGGVLATNLGAVLGLTLARGTRLNAVALQAWNAPTTESLQIIAAFLYVAGLITAIVFWGTKGFTGDPNKVVSTLPELGRTLFGVFVGALAVALGVAQ